MATPTPKRNLHQWRVWTDLEGMFNGHRSPLFSFSSPFPLKENSGVSARLTVFIFGGQNFWSRNSPGGGRRQFRTTPIRGCFDLALWTCEITCLNRVLRSQFELVRHITKFQWYSFANVFRFHSWSSLVLFHENLHGFFAGLVLSAF